MSRIRYITVEQRPRNVLMQALGFIVGVLVLAASIILGAFLLAALLGLVLIVAVAVYLRLWWLRRRMARGQGDEEIIEAEYRVLRTSTAKNDDTDR